MTQFILSHIWWLLFMLPGVFGSTADTSPNLAIVLILLFVFLLLFMLLVFSWHKLNLDTDDKYHPKRLWYGSDDEEEGRGGVARLAGAVAGRWQTLRTRVMGDSSIRLDQSEAVVEQDQEEVLEDGDMESAGEEDARQDTEGESEADETDSDDDFSSMEGYSPGIGRAQEAANLPEKNAADEAATGTSEVLLSDGPTETKVDGDPTVGTSEALLSNRHPFSGSVTWEDEVPEGSVRVHVTAL